MYTFQVRQIAPQVQDVFPGLEFGTGIDDTEQLLKRQGCPNSWRDPPESLAVDMLVLAAVNKILNDVC